MQFTYHDLEHFNHLHQLKKTLSKSIKHWRSNSRYSQTINYDFCLNKFPICCLLIVSKVVVKFMYCVGYGHAEYVLYKH